MDGGEATRRWARKRGIEEQRLYEISKLRRQFRELLEDAELIEKKSLDEIAGGVQGSAERRIRAGEMRKLRDLKRKARHEEKKRKVLKRDQHYDSIMDEAEDRADVEDTQEARSSRTEDVHALEFSMSHTDFEVHSTLYSHHLNHSTATIIKVIICAGLYPQFAILDEHNVYKHGTDQLAHTRAKPFLVLHPNSCLAQEPDILAITKDARGHSANHQLIFYGLLLETTKPYICNSMRVPALHIALLFARNIEASADTTRIVCDDFVELELDNGDQGAAILAEAQRIRDMLAKCLERKLQGESYRSRDLLKRLVGFTCNEVVFGLKRVVNPAKRLLREGLHIGDIGGRDAPGGGGASAAFLSTRWTCAHCNGDFISNPAEKIHHMQTCVAVAAPAVPEGMEGQIEETVQRPPGSKEFHCPVCKETLWLTAVNILKHKRLHDKKDA